MRIAHFIIKVAQDCAQSCRSFFNVAETFILVVSVDAYRGVDEGTVDRGSLHDSKYHAKYCMR